MPTALRRYKRVACVVEALPPVGGLGLALKEEDMAFRLRDFSILVPCRYWAILHDRDKDDDGNLKRPHFHVVIETRSKKTITGFVRDIAETLLIAENRVSVRETRNLNGSIRYLLHLDDEDKARYNVFDIMTNAKDGLVEALANPYDDLTMGELIKLVDEAPDRLSLMRRIGLANYTRYKGVINEIIQEKNKFL